MKYYLIGSEDAYLGFSMAGVEGRAVRTEAEARNALEEALADQQIGIIIITEPVADLIRSQVDHHSFTPSFPLIVEIPGENGPEEHRPTIRELVRQAIGIQV